MVNAIVKALKAIIDAVTKVIAWLLIALGLWIPLVYSLLFVIVVVLFTDAQLASLGTIYFFGLFLSFVGALWFSMRRSAKKIKNRKAKKLSHNVSEVQKKTDEAVISKEEQPPTIKNDSATRPTASYEDEQNNKSESRNIEELEQKERAPEPKQRSVWDEPTVARTPEPQREWNEPTRSRTSEPQREWDEPTRSRTPEPQREWNEPTRSRTPEPQREWNEPTRSRTPEPQREWDEPTRSRTPEPSPWDNSQYNEPRSRNYEPIDDGISDRRREPRSQWNGDDNSRFNDSAFDEPQNTQRSQPWNEPTRSRSPEQSWDEPTRPYYGPVDNGWGDRRGEPTSFDNTDFGSQFDNGPQRNQWEPQDQWGRQNASDPYRNQPAPEQEFNRYDRSPRNNDPGQRAPEPMGVYERPLAVEEPKIFRLRNEPGVLVYEYSDRLDYYRESTRGNNEFLRRKFKN